MADTNSYNVYEIWDSHVICGALGFDAVILYVLTNPEYGSRMFL